MILRKSIKTALRESLFHVHAMEEHAIEDVIEDPDSLAKPQ